jgi:uncharacterized protein (DUF433 family)
LLLTSREHKEITEIMTAGIITAKQYIEEREGCYRIVGKRISLDSIVYAFLAGQSPESIVQSFPALTLEEVYGAITFYLANRTAIDAYLLAGEQLFETLRQQARENNSLLYQKLYST